MDFYGNTNRDYVMINTIVFRLKTGEEVTVDRDYTGYNIDEDGNLGMTWKGCYFWDGNIAKYLTEKDEKELTEAELVGVDIEDDADEDYYVVINEWN